MELLLSKRAIEKSGRCCFSSKCNGYFLSVSVVIARDMYTAILHMALKIVVVY